MNVGSTVEASARDYRVLVYGFIQNTVEFIDIGERVRKYPAPCLTTFSLTRDEAGLTVECSGDNTRYSNRAVPVQSERIRRARSNEHREGAARVDGPMTMTMREGDERSSRFYVYGAYALVCVACRRTSTHPWRYE